MPPWGCYSVHLLALQPGSETGSAVFLEIELMIWLFPRNLKLLFHFYMYRHLFGPVCILSPSFANLQITNFVSKRTIFFSYRYPLCQRVNKVFCLHLHNLILTPGKADNAGAAVQVSLNQCRVTATSPLLPRFSHEF